MEVKGKLVKILNVEKGVSKAGKEWSSQSIVIDNGAKFNPELCIKFFGDKADLLQGVELGNDVTVKINLSSREFNGKWFHAIDGYAITGGSQNEMASNESNQSVDNGVDDLPF